jgi:catechol 2,3-dioxygenase-like lactoylglutathione lyase family enzyme
LLLVVGGGPTPGKPTVTFAPPVDRGGEIRAFFRDPDGHLLEISELT